jgi:hypothetical protein
MGLLADRHARLQFAHSLLRLVRVDGGPHVRGPMAVNCVRVVVLEKYVAVIGFVVALHGPDGRGKEAGSAFE